MAVRQPKLTKLADLVVAAMNSHFTLTATRQNVPTVKLSDMDTLKIVVVPSTKEHTRKSRGLTERDYQVEIGLFQRIDQTPAAQALTEDQTIALAEEILEWWIDDQQGVTYTADGEDTIPIYCTGGRLANNEPFDLSIRRTDSVVRVIIQLDFKVI